MSSRAAGNRFELRIKGYLESLGWVVDKARATLKFVGPGKCYSSPCDFWGFGDLIGIHPQKPYTLVVQAHKGTNVGERKAKAEAVPWNPIAQRVQVWTPVDGLRSGIRVWSLQGGHWREFFFRMKEGEPPLEGMF